MTFLAFYVPEGPTLECTHYHLVATGYKTQLCSVQGQDLLKMVTQVASEMYYLAEKKITHYFVPVMC